MVAPFADHHTILGGLRKQGGRPLPQGGSRRAVLDVGEATEPLVELAGGAGSHSALPDLLVTVSVAVCH